MFQVEWLQEALDELTVLWLQADAALRQAITAATHAIDQELGQDPYRHSESREDDERVLFAFPLAVQWKLTWAVAKSGCCTSGVFGAAALDSGPSVPHRLPICSRRSACA